MNVHSGEVGGSSHDRLLTSRRSWALHPEAPKGRILVVEDEEMIRDAMVPFLEEAGYEVSFAENGKEAFRQLSTEIIPQLIVLDLRMPVMDGWEFRAIQRNDPRLGLIPVVAISADGSAQAAAISADAYLRKPLNPSELLVTVERVLFESERRMSAQRDETERLTSLGRLAANVGHEINNPLTFLMLNLRQSLEKLEPAISPRKKGSAAPSVEAQLKELQGRMVNIAEMLHDCEVGGERIRVTVSNLQQLSRHADEPTGPLDLHKLIDQSVAMVWNQIRHRGRLVKAYGKIPLILGNGTALGQVFLNLLLNAAQSIPDGDATHNAIQISTSMVPGEKGAELLVEISDSGKGISPENMSHLFEPFFTTKPFGEGTGLGLSISHQTVRDHGGRITVESSSGKGTTFRVFLPVGAAVLPSPVIIGPVKTAAPARGRVLVIDDEPLVGRVIQNVLKREHEVVVVERAGDALIRLQGGERFDAILCDLLMPDMSGPEFYTAVAEHWPDLIERLVFMSGGAFTPATRAFIAHLSPCVLPKPFEIDQLKEVVRERIGHHAPEVGTPGH